MTLCFSRQQYLAMARFQKYIIDLRSSSCAHSLDSAVLHAERATALVFNRAKEHQSVVDLVSLVLLVLIFLAYYLTYLFV